MKKRLLAMALVLIMAFTLLPASALALEEPPDEEDIEELLNNGLLAGKRWIDVVFHTKDEKDAGTSSNIRMEIEYVDGDVWGDTPDEISYFNHDGSDFDRGATDSYKRLIPDKQIKSYKIVKEGNNDWYLHSVELDGYLYKVNKKLGNNETHTIYAEKYDERLRPLTVVFYTADEKDAETDADVWVEIEYEDGTVFGHIDPNHPKDNHVETPLLDNDGNDFERGNMDLYTFSIIDKPVRKYIINENLKGDDWLLDRVEIDGVMYAVPGRWLKGNLNSFTIEPGKTPLARDVRITVETGDWDGGGGGTDAGIEVIFYVQDLQNLDVIYESREYNLSGTDNYHEAGDVDTYDLIGVPAGNIIYCDFSLHIFNDDWGLESVRINEDAPVKVHDTVKAYGSYTVDMGTKLTEKTMDVYTVAAFNGRPETGVNGLIKFTYKDGTDSGYINLDSPVNDFATQHHSIYTLRILDREIADITLRNNTEENLGIAYFILDGVQHSVNKVLIPDNDYTVAYKAPGTGSTFSDVNTGLIIGIGVPVIVIAAAAVIVVLRKKKKHSADTAE